MKLERGQALVESAIALAMLAVVLGAIPCFTAYHDIQRATLRAARDASYMAGWSGLSDPATLTRRASEALLENAWSHPADGRRLVTSLEAGAVSHGESQPPGRAAELMEFIARPLGATAGGLGASIELNRAGYHTTSIAVDVPAIRGAPQPFSQLTLKLSERTRVLTDSWNAGSPSQVVERTRPLVPSAGLKEMIEPLRVLAAPLQILEPAFAQLCIGLIEPDRVPETRLGSGIAARVGNARSVPCR